MTTHVSVPTAEAVVEKSLKGAKQQLSTQISTSPAVAAKGADQTANIYLLMMIMVDLMKINNEEQMVGAKQAEAQSQVLTSVGQQLSSMNPQLTDSSHFGTSSLLASVFTAGIWDLVCYAKSGNIDGLESSVGDDGPSQSNLMALQNQQQQLGLIGTQANQAMQTAMQIHVTQSSQYNSSLGSQWSQMLQVWQQESNTSNNR